MTEPRLGPGQRGTIAVLLGAAMLIPPAVAIVTMTARPWYPVSDLAIIDLQVRDVFSAHTPLTGLWSRPGWSHPGPLAYWLLAVFSKPFGQPAWATRVGGAVLGFVAIATLAFVTWRRGLRLLVAAALVCGGMYLATGPWIFRQPWNVHLPLPFFVLFVFLGVVVAEGAVRHVATMALVASYIVQTHLGYALLVGVGFAWSIGWLLVDARRGRRPVAGWRSTALTTAAILAVVWLPPVIDEFVNSPGNLHRIAAYFAGGGYSHVGISRAAGIFADEFRIVPPWLGGPDRQTPYVGFAHTASVAWFLVPVILLGAGFLATRTTRAWRDRRRLGLALVLAISAVVAISRADEPRSYTFQWRAVIAAFVVVMSLSALVRRIAPHPSRRMLGLLGIAGVAAVTAAAIISTASPVSVTAGPPEVREATLRAFSDRLSSADAMHGTIYLHPYGTALHSLLDGLVDQLDREGVEVLVPPELGRLYGQFRVGQPHDADKVWYVTEQGDRIAELLAVPGSRVVLSSSPLTPSQDAELTRLQMAIGSQLRRAHRTDLLPSLDTPLVAFAVASVPGVDRDEATRLGELNQLVLRRATCRCAIVQLPRGATPPRDRAR